MVVIKLGGSLLFSPYLRRWLQQIATASVANSSIIVPGGGCFADQVRRAQEHWGLADSAAHDMAILAMEQFAYLLLALQPELVPLIHWQMFNDDGSQPRARVLLPRCLLGCDDLEKSWHVSSDSLSLWLSDRLQAEHLYLIKSTALAPGPHHADTLSAGGLLDQCFPKLLRKTKIPVSWYFAEDYASFPAATAAGPVILG